MHFTNQLHKQMSTNDTSRGKKGELLRNELAFTAQTEAAATPTPDPSSTAVATETASVPP